MHDVAAVKVALEAGQPLEHLRLNAAMSEEDWTPEVLAQLQDQSWEDFLAVISQPEQVGSLQQVMHQPVGAVRGTVSAVWLQACHRGSALHMCSVVAAAHSDPRVCPVSSCPEHAKGPGLTKSCHVWLCCWHRGRAWRALASSAANDTAAASAPLACSQQELVPRSAGWGELCPSASDSLESSSTAPRWVGHACSGITGGGQGLKAEAGAAAGAGATEGGEGRRNRPLSRYM